MNNDCILIIEGGNYPGSYYVPADLVKYINTETLSSTYSSDIYCVNVEDDSSIVVLQSYAHSYHIYTDSIEQIAVTYESASLNAYGKLLHDSDLFMPVIVTMLLFFSAINFFRRS